MLEASQYDFDIVNEGDVAIIVVNLSRATLNEAPLFKKNILNEIVDKGNTKIVVDLLQCEFIDSTFLGVLVFGLKKVSEYNGDIKLVITSNMKSIFNNTNTLNLFEVYPNLEEAKASYN